MTAGARIIAAVVRLLPRERRALRREEWLADLAGADELGMRPSAVVLGAVTAAVGESIRAVTPRRAVATLGVLLGVAVIATPAAAVAALLIDDARGVVTRETAADGTQRDVFWRDYPGIPELEPEEVLAGPTLEEGEATGRAMLAEIEAELTERLGLSWAPPPGPADDQVAYPTENRYGGPSLLRVLNVPSRQSTAVPPTWGEKEAAIAIIGEVAARYGYGEVRLDHDAEWLTPDEADNAYGGSTPETSVVVSGMLTGPTGQWLSFSMQDLTLDRTGRFTDQFDGSADYGWLPKSISLLYGANGLLPEADRAAFEQRLEPYRGLARPEPRES